MIILYHGEDYSKSRLEFVELKDKARALGEVSVLDFSEKYSIAELYNFLSSDSLFEPTGKEKTVFIDNGFSKGDLFNNNELIDLLRKTKAYVYIWEKKAVALSKIKKILPALQDKLFSYPKEIFRFVDSIGKYNSEELIKAFHRIRKNTEDFIIFTMIARQFRLLLIAKTCNRLNLKNIASWQETKLKAQALNFEKEVLIRKYREILDIDYRIKRGNTPLELDKLIDFLLAAI